jgi:hypothetical protein
VIGDVTVAALCNQDDAGLLVLDNKEQKNLDQKLIDYCLFLSTGARRLRSNSEGTETRTSNEFRPVGVITSIEGVHKAELEARNVPILFSVPGRKIGREGIEREITSQRDSINSALMVVLQRFLRVQRQKRPTPNPFNGNFDAHFTTLCDLLRAFGEVAGRPTEWAERLIAAWNRIISQRKVETEDSEYEYPILAILTSKNYGNVEHKPGVLIDGQVGSLYVFQCAFLLRELRKEPGLLASLPKNPQGFSNRLSSERFQSMRFLKEADAPEHLKRKNSVRFVGIFIPSDNVTTGDQVPRRVVTPVSPMSSVACEVVVTM